MAEVFRTTRRMEFRDTDAAGIVHFSQFFVFMEQAEHAFWRTLGLSVVFADQGREISWPRVSAKCDYRSPLRFEDEVSISMSIARVGTKSVTFAFRFQLADREVAAGELSVVCCEVTASGKPVSIPIPDWLRQKLQPA